jgi:hypothetical protein
MSNPAKPESLKKNALPHPDRGDNANDNSGRSFSSLIDFQALKSWRLLPLLNDGSGLAFELV